MAGVFDFLTKVTSGVNQAASAVIQGKQTYDATKAAWKGVPFQFPAAPTQSFPGVPYQYPQATAPVPDRALTKAEVADLQATLNALGHNTGVVDGIVGPNTRAGITSFQRALGVAQNGYVTMALYQAAKNALASRGGAQTPAPHCACSGAARTAARARSRCPCSTDPASRRRTARP